jgi:hypothetical protein
VGSYPASGDSGASENPMGESTGAVVVEGLDLGIPALAG